MAIDPSILFREKFLRNQLAFNSRYHPLFEKVAEDIARLSKDPMARFTNAFTFPASINRKIELIITKFHDQDLALTEREIIEAWGLSNQKNDVIVNNYLKTIAGIKGIDVTQYYSTSLPALKAFIGRGEGTDTLSGAVWKISNQLRAEMEIHLGIGIMNGDSAATISQRIRQYLNNPDALFRSVRDASGNLVASKAMIANAPGQGVYNSAYKNAMRVARTETNMAYLLADHIRWRNMDMVIGVNIELSDQHPDYKYPEICEILEGEYPKDFIFIGWHPQCLCHATPIMSGEDEFMAFLRGDKEDIKAEQITKYPPDFEIYVKGHPGQMSEQGSNAYWIKNNRALIAEIATS